MPARDVAHYIQTLIMGCVYSNSSDSDPRIFRVMNVDDRGLERNPGKIEITDTDLILYRRGDDPVRWPLRCLRRYGFDSELFSFESGRRCPTGQGIYAFKCHQAEALFNLLQECVAKAGQDDQVIERGTNDPVQANEPLNINVPPYSLQVQNDRQYMNGDIVQSANQSITTQVSVPNGSDDIHDYINTHIAPTNRSSVTDPGTLQVEVSTTAGAQENGKVIKYAVLNLPTLPEGITRGRLPSIQTDISEADTLRLDPSSSQATYINVGKDDVQIRKNSDVFVNETTQVVPPNGHALRPPMNLQLVENEPAPYANVSLVPGPSKPRAKKPHYKEKWGDRTITYVELDLREDNQTVPASPISVASSSNLDSPSRRTDSYAKIDITRTRALENSTKQNDEDGSRKTRHNSNIDELS